ncbi:hypothetical protein HDV00_000330 [Rhizophlyctis rosea]|nr:hypothetical protein HDV00_000330 [Rhizophlyctis rosea]
MNGKLLPEASRNSGPDVAVLTVPAQGDRADTTPWHDEQDELRHYGDQLNEEVTVDSSIEHLRHLSESMQHPAHVLGVYPNEQDLTTYTEFDDLCSETLTVVGEFETALEDMTMWKDDFLRQSVPSNVKLQLTLLFARLFRSKSDMHEPMFELIKKVRLYSRPWLDKRFALVELEKDWQRYLAWHLRSAPSIRKLEKLQMQILRIRSEKRVALWERVTKRLMDIFIGGHGQFSSIGEAQTSAVPALPVAEPPPVRQQPSSAATTASRGGRSRAITPTARESLNRGPPPLQQTLSSAREYITEDSPSWRKKAKTQVRKFNHMLRDQYPSYETILGRAHRRPFPQPVQPKYLSTQAGSIIDRPKRIPNLRKSWSEIDLRVFHEDTLDTELQQLGKPRTPTDPLRMDERERERERGIWRAMAVQRERARSVSRGRSAKRSYDDSDEEESDDDDYSTFDERYMTEFDDEQMQETINQFIDEHPFGPSEERDFSEIMNDVDGSKECFTLQDVMELTLLHAQQMQILQTEYEDRVETLNKQITDMETATAEMRAEYEKRIALVQERAQRIALEYVKQSKEGAASDVSSPSDSANKALLEDLGVQDAAPVPVQEVKRKKTQSRGRSRFGWRERKTPTRRVLHLVQRRVLPPRDKPVFTSAPFTMSFMERLRWFTEMKLQKRGAIENKFRTIEKAANEERLAQYHLLADEPKDTEGVGGGPSGTHLPAEFMPMPGSVPPHKIRDVWQEQGIHMPWGGRYSVARRDLEQINILNLFDVAMNLPPQTDHHVHPQPEEQNEREMY